MKTSVRSKLTDNTLVAFLLFNAISTTVMYFVVLVLGKHSPTLDIARTRAYAFADIPFTILPQLFAAYGILRRRNWGPVLVLVIAAVYLHAMTVLIAEDLISGRIGAMFYMDFYFLAFAIGAILYGVKMLRAQEG